MSSKSERQRVLKNGLPSKRNEKPSGISITPGRSILKRRTKANKDMNDREEKI